MYGKSNFKARFFFASSFSAQEPIQIHYYIVHPGPSLSEPPLLDVWDHMKRRQAFFYLFLRFCGRQISIRARLPVTQSLQKKSIIIIVFPQSLVLTAASTDLDIRLVRNEYLISSHKPNSSRGEHINAPPPSLLFPQSSDI